MRIVQRWLPLVLLGIAGPAAAQTITIAEARIDANNDGVPDKLTQVVTVQGIITSPNYTVGTNPRLSQYFQDATGGLSVSKSGSNDPIAAPGTMVTITGMITQFNGLTQIVPTTLAAPDVVVGTTGNPLPAPVTLTLAQLLANAEMYESQRVRVNGYSPTATSVGWPAVDTDANQTVTDDGGTTTITLRIDRDTDIDGSPEPTYPTNAIGIATQFASSGVGGYQFQPMFRSEIGLPAAVSTNLVTFNIDARQLILDGRLLPATEQIGVRGGTAPLDWGTTAIAADPDGDGIYTLTLDFGTATGTVDYKFKREPPRSGGTTDEFTGWESGGNRTFTLSGNPQSVTRTFNDEPPAVLPVELTSFTARSVNGSVELAWTTASETNNAGFSVQRASGSSWVELAFVSGHNTTVEAQRYGYTDRTATGVVRYRLVQRDFDGTTTVGPTVEASTVAPQQFALLPASPNPFNPTTSIGYQLAAAGAVKLEVFDALGHRVRTLVDEQKSAGAYTATFDAVGLPSGVYLVRLNVGTRVQAQRILLAK